MNYPDYDPTRERDPGDADARLTMATVALTQPVHDSGQVVITRAIWHVIGRGCRPKIAFGSVCIRAGRTSVPVHGVQG